MRVKREREEYYLKKKYITRILTKFPFNFEWCSDTESYLYASVSISETASLNARYSTYSLKLPSKFNIKIKLIKVFSKFEGKV